MIGRGRVAPLAVLLLGAALTSAVAAACTVGPGSRGAASAAPASPPSAHLTGPGAGSVPGVVGGYAYGGAGAAAPWIPATALAPVALGSSAPLAIALEPDAIGGWTLRISPAADTQGADAIPLVEGDRPAPDGSIRFAGPPAGRWVIEARIVYASGLGDGAYYWLLAVRP